MRSAPASLIGALLVGCSGSVFLPGGDGGLHDAAAQLGDGAMGARDLATSATCASITCGAHAHCDPVAVACACDNGFGGDPKAGCAAQTPCGNCPLFSHCDSGSNTCACDPGYQLANAQCAVAPIVDPAARSSADVCAAWRQGHAIVDGNPWKNNGTMCDPGTLSRAGIDDTLRRGDLFRWLAGLYPATDDAGWDAKDQECAIMESVAGTLNHMPPNTWACWTQNAYDASSSSNLAYGQGNAADAIDLFMDDPGTPSLGHRRWVLNPPLDGVGVGFAAGFTCYHVFGANNMAPPSKWQGVPNQGPTPLAVAQYANWSFHADGVDLSAPTISVTRKDDGMPMPVAVVPLPNGYGVNAVGFTHASWMPEAGKTYTVQVGGTSLGAVSYDVQPVNCP